MGNVLSPLFPAEKNDAPAVPGDTILNVTSFQLTPVWLVRKPPEPTTLTRFEVFPESTVRCARSAPDPGVPRAVNVVWKANVVPGNPSVPAVPLAPLIKLKLAAEN